MTTDVTVTETGSGTYTQEITAGSHRIIAERCPVHQTLTSEVRITTTAV
ncbi:hypothetical protein [Mycobacterium sp. 155]|nr:hypothetical protein [Mycobacterium sp. 155]